ncbi:MULTISPECIES: hypothetical protein, partial [unclassified Bradyrhizobium]|uniref:hypothetical protein n=1 Tax=unclassified Bradyrhizobium TaxID=2631580 RepID=UPI001FFC1949
RGVTVVPGSEVANFAHSGTHKTARRPSIQPVKRIIRDDITSMNADNIEALVHRLADRNAIPDHAVAADAPRA